MYPTLLSNNGARHTNDGATFLGTSIDNDSDGQQSAIADGDDNDVGDTLSQCADKFDATATMVCSPPELDNHNYAKSPEMLDMDGRANDGIDKFEKQQLQTVKNSDVKIQIAVSDDKEGSVMPTTVATTDITKPLIIQTRFGNLPPGPSTGSSTDTASEVGSCLSSPVCSTGMCKNHNFEVHSQTLFLRR